MSSPQWCALLSRRCAHRSPLGLPSPSLSLPLRTSCRAVATGAPAMRRVSATPLQQQQQQQALRVAACQLSTTRVWQESEKTPAHEGAPAVPHGERHGNFFAFFGFPRHPVLDGSALQKRYHALQLEVHPDKQQDTPPSPPPAAAASKSMTDISVYANAAYETLKNPFLRCRYLSQLERALELKNRDAAAAGADRDAWVALTPAEEEALAHEDDTRSVRIAEAAPLRPLDESFMEEVLAMNELIFAGDREDELVRNQMAVLRRDLEERDEDYYDRAVKLWDAKNYFEFYHLMLEWTYITNALNHVKDRL